MVCSIVLFRCFKYSSSVDRIGKTTFHNTTSHNTILPCLILPFTPPTGNGYHGSQFLITTTENADALDGLHTVFGIVTEGKCILYCCV